MGYLHLLKLQLMIVGDQKKLTPGKQFKTYMINIADYLAKINFSWGNFIKLNRFLY